MILHKIINNGITIINGEKSELNRKNERKVDEKLLIKELGRTRRLAIVAGSFQGTRSLQLSPDHAGSYTDS